MSDLIAAAEQRMGVALSERAAKQDVLLSMRAAVEAGDATITDEHITEAIASRDAADVALKAAEAKVAELRAEQAEDERIHKLMSQVHDTGVKRAYDQVARVGQEARTYTAEAEHNFVRDFLSATFVGDFEARDRLARHMKEERTERAHYFKRDVGTGAFAGLTVPQYLTDLVAPLARAGRPLADNARKLPLPASGMTVNLSRITTGTATAVQAAEAGAVQETNIDDTLLTVDVRTIAGQQDISFQALQRSVGAEQVILEDLVRAYHTNLDNQIINGTGTNGQHRGILNVVGLSAATYTDATPTVAEALGSLYEIQSTIETAVFRSPTHLVMHPRRWAWFRAGIGSDAALISQGSQYPALTWGVSGSSEYGAGVRGDLAGLPVIVDGNIPTTLAPGTADTILAVNADELFLWEDPGAPLFIRADQPGAGNLTSKLVVYGFSAFTAGRCPAANGSIKGTGLIAPASFGKTVVS